MGTQVTGLGSNVVNPDPELFASAELEPDPNPISNRMTKVLTGKV